MTTYNQQLRLRVWQRYRRDVSDDPSDLHDVAEWAIKNGLWRQRPADIAANCAKELAIALREEKRVDEKGREYRANIPVRAKDKSGEQLVLWDDIDKAPRAHVEKSLQQERRAIVSHCYALEMKVAHYNDAHPDEDPIQLCLDFTDDVEEQKIARDLERSDDVA